MKKKSNAAPRKRNRSAHLKPNPLPAGDGAIQSIEEPIMPHEKSIATKKRIASAIQEKMRALKLTRATLAKAMQTTPAEVDRMLDPEFLGLRLDTIQRCAAAMGYDFQIVFHGRAES